MKRTAFILLIALLFSITACTKAPDSSDSDSSDSGDISLLTETITCPDASVQFSHDDSYNYDATYAAVPTKLDLNALAKQDYYIKIEATYDVHYEKDFDTPLDIGYLGAPDHDAYIVDQYDKGTKNKNLSTSTTKTTETISLVVSAKSFSNTDYYLRLMTYNLQNIVHFTNVKITFTCQKTQ